MPQTLSQAMIDGTLGDMTQPPGDPLPWYLDMAESIPTISAVAGTKAFRGSGTVLRGGSGANIGRGGWVREGLRQANYARPRNWMQFGTQDYFHHQGPLTSVVQGPTKTGKPLRQTTYNPFYMAAGINAVGRGLGGQSQGRIGQRLAKTSLGESLTARGFVGEGKELMAKGAYSRVSAAGRIGWMSDRQFGRAMGSTSQFLQGAGYTAEGAASVMRGGKASAQAAVLTSGSGTLSSRVGGFMARAGRPIDGHVMSHLNKTAALGDTPAANAARQALKGHNTAARWGRDIGLQANKTYTARQMVSESLKTGRTVARGQGGRMAGAKVVGKGVAMGGARVAGLAVPGVNVAMAAWLVYDLAKLTAKGVGHAARIGVDAHKSFQGGLATGIMEQGFRDTEATMTSRARGVHAIQNSRLNARGVLGAEASAMHAHFG